MNELLAAHLDRVLRFLHRLTGDSHEAADLAQETFLRAWRGRESLRDAQAARTWLLRIATNVFRDWLRQAQRRREVTSLEADGAEPPCRASTSSNRNHAARLEQEEALAAAIRGLQTLPPRQREVLTLHACEELSIEEIAQVLQIERTAVKASLSVARATMRRNFAEQISPEQDTTEPAARQPVQPTR